MENLHTPVLELSSIPKTKKEKAKRAWIRLEKWIKAKGLKVVVIIEGEENKTAKKWVKRMQEWSADESTIQRVKLKKVTAEKSDAYFASLFLQLPKAGQISVFENCWFQKAIAPDQKGVWHTSLWENFKEVENSLTEKQFIILKYAFKNQNTENANLPIFEILKKTENTDCPFFYFNCWEKKSEPYNLVQHLAQQIPHDDLTFPHESIQIDVLKKRAFNLRWATLEEGIIPLTAADPDFPIAPEIQQAINDYTSAGYFSYGPPTGLPEFRNAASKVLAERKGITCPPEQIFPTDSAASAMYTVAKFALKPGDEAIIFDPVDFLFQKSVEAAGGKVVRISMRSKSGTFDPKQFADAITKKTKMICLCNPHNPMGRVFSRQELLFIGSMAVKHQLWIMNDEVWSDIVYPEHQHINIASLHPEVAKLTISVYDFSKNFGLAGLRIGFIATPSVKVFDKIFQTSQAHSTAGGVSTLSQVAATAAYEKCWYWADAFLDHLTKVRDYCLQRLNAMPGVECRKPEGTYLIFPNIKKFGMSSEEIAMYLLEHAKVAVVPGTAEWFGPGAEGHIRICFSTSMEIMKEAMDRMEVALAKLYQESQIRMEEVYFKNFDPDKVVFQ